jgi:hypothetical protein
LPDLGSYELIVKDCPLVTMLHGSCQKTAFSMT